MLDADADFRKSLGTKTCPPKTAISLNIFSTVILLAFFSFSFSYSILPLLHHDNDVCVTELDMEGTRGSLVFQCLASS